MDATALRLVVPGTGISAGTCIDELEVNPPPPVPDLAFDLELKATITEVPGSPFTASDETWVELYNRGSQVVDVSGWQIQGGARFTMPPGTQIPASGYLVVAKRAAELKALWPEVDAVIVGDLSGKLSAGEPLRLLDAVGNPVNQIHVPSGTWSDGGGSSVELVDSRADNDSADAWRDSDESGRGEWQTIRYRMISGQRFGNTFWNEFRLGFLAPGVALIDDVQVLRDPDGVRQSLIQNGDFESTEANPHWRLLGDHSRSRIAADPSNPANPVLWMEASSPARTSHNHVESTFAGNKPIVDGQLYEVSFRARWIAGSPQVNSSAYHQRLAKTTLLKTSPRHGTPGAPNSRRVPNFGPTFSGLRHLPVFPRTNDPVTVSVRISDPDGVAGATLNYRLNRSNLFNALPMSLQADGSWSATMPPQTAGRVVQFFVSAADSLGASNTAPALGPASRALYQVADAQATKLPLHELRLIQLDSDRIFLLNLTNVMSQERLGGTVIYDRSEVFYDCGVRLHGSAASRARDGDDYVSYDIEFPVTKPFRGVQGSVGVDRSGRAPVVRNQDEIYVLHMFHRAGLICHWDDLCYFVAPYTTHTGTAILQLGAYDSLFVNEQFSGDGSIFNFDGTYEPSITDKGGAEGLKVAVPLLNQEATDLTDLGGDLEQYRAPFDIRHGERGDDFSGIQRLCRTFDLSQGEFEKAAGTALDVEGASRAAAMTILCGIGDIYLSPVPSFPHNLRIWTPADGGPAVFLPWDMDFVFYLDPNESVLPTTSAHFSKLAGSPAFRRRYLWHVNDLCNTAFHPSYMGPWLTHYGSVVGQALADNVSYIQTRRAAALSQIPAPLTFLLKSPGPNPVLIAQGVDAVIEGVGGIDVDKIRLAPSGLDLPVVWTTLTNWRVRVPVMLGVNAITIEGRDRAGSLLGSGQVSVVGAVFGGGVDSDGDGIPDAWEDLQHLDPLLNDAEQDPDGDGRTNLQEYRAGTDPHDADSVLALQVVGAGGDGVKLRFQARAGRSYSVMWREDIAGNGWNKLEDAEPQVADRAVEVIGPWAGTTGRRFYQVVTPRQP
ncbi:MAG: CotH kinase family protein [Verrucomicrobia bacterium]|nr:CotH kinase family protein [Verrucomicrobiota bacterium]